MPFYERAVGDAWGGRGGETRREVGEVETDRVSREGFCGHLDTAEGEPGRGNAESYEENEIDVWGES